MQLTIIICKQHTERALELVLRAISLFEHEWGKEKLKDAEEQFPHRSWGRFGARLYYLAGGILVGKARHEEAVMHLQKAVMHCKGWGELEFAIRRLLVDCYKNIAIAPDGDPESSQMMIANMMEACFNSNLSITDLSETLDKCGSICTTDCIKWQCECYDEFDSRIPFSFSVTFPGKSHSTAGDTVTASVMVRSNLDYTARVSCVTLLSLAGPMPVPSSNLLAALESLGASGDSLIIEPRSEVVFTTEIELPKDPDEIATEEDDKKGASGKASFAKSARPRTAGITSAGKSYIAVMIAFMYLMNDLYVSGFQLNKNLSGAISFTSWSEARQ